MSTKEETLHFKVSSDLKSILGRDLITNENIAVLELVKNAYDAHATKVNITFDDDMLEISDNGKGMTYDDIVNKWLFVGYSAKKDGTEDKSYRSKINRSYAGAKGIGRLSCDRLSRYLVMTTKSESSSTVETIEVDWKQFEGHPKDEFDQIDIKRISSDTKLDFPSGSSTGTTLRFTGLYVDWTDEKILVLRRTLEKMINPFADTEDFSIEIFAPHHIKSDNDLKASISELKLQEDMMNPNERFSLAKKEKSILNGVIHNSISEVLTIKTTQIEVELKDNRINTKLTDRGQLMFEIEEQNPYSHLQDVSISLYYLNRAAKYNFSLIMGLPLVSYGNVFLFRNRVRIWPYGEYQDDSWGLNQRAQQGIHRSLSTRDLFGRVDVETTDMEAFKEVSSRDGGLVETPSSLQLMALFRQAHHRLERYVVGVLWGEGFVRNNYFKNKESGLAAREQLKQNDKDSSSPDALYNNLGSQVDFLQLVKSLVNDNQIQVKSYNSQLANIVANPSAEEIVQDNVLNDLRKVAERTHDEELLSSVRFFEDQLTQLRKQKEEAERKAKENERQKELAQKKAEEERKKREAEEELRKQREKELHAEKQQSLYLSSTRHVTPEVEDLLHAVSLSSTKLSALWGLLTNGFYDKTLSHEEISGYLDEMRFYIDRIDQISKMLTKADIKFLSEEDDVDIKEYVKSYIKNFSSSIPIVIGEEYEGLIMKRIPILDLSVIIDNLVSNSEKANAKEITIDFKANNQVIELYFSDDGDGVNLTQYTPGDLFKPGVTNRRGGSGIGLSTIKRLMAENLRGEIEFYGNAVRYKQGATFKLIFN